MGEKRTSRSWWRPGERPVSATEVPVVESARTSPLGQQCCDERAERGRKRGELGEHELENSLIASADVCPELLSHACDVRREMAQRGSHLGKDLERKLTWLLHEESVLRWPKGR
jgi:hypothetical protein